MYAVSNEVIFRLSNQGDLGDLRLSVLFDELAQLAKNKQIEDFMISRTTLEQVFVKFAKH